MTSASDSDRRDATRFPADARLFASIDGRTVVLRDISRSGVAIRAHGLEVGSVHLLEVHLDHQHVTLAIRIVDSSDSLLHAQFVDPGDVGPRLVEHYLESIA
ncbi:MAG: PilZ domain-containing protein [Gammaproteobacteria bacterium]|nr:PilZ domain-containing protein [Gammaproteobacteria bacterium]